MKQKMMSGIPLTDDDRWPWLGRLNGAMKQVTQTWSVVTCSALKKAYRQKLTEGLEGTVRFIFLDAPKQIIEERMRLRKHEYMPISLLDSQLATLETPGSDEPVVRIPVSGSEDETFDLILEAIS
jgi:gluconokinase